MLETDAAGKWSAGRWPSAFGLHSSARHWPWRSRPGGRSPSSSTTATTAANTRRSPSANGSGRPACSPRWAVSAMPTTMPSRKRSPRSPRLADPGGGAARDLRAHRNVAQPQAAALDPGLSATHRARDTDRGSSGTEPGPVRITEATPAWGGRTTRTAPVAGCLVLTALWALASSTGEASALRYSAAGTGCGGGGPA